MSFSIVSPLVSLCIRKVKPRILFYPDIDKDDFSPNSQQMQQKARRQDLTVGAHGTGQALALLPRGVQSTFRLRS